MQLAQRCAKTSGVARDHINIHQPIRNMSRLRRLFSTISQTSEPRVMARLDGFCYQFHPLIPTLIFPCYTNSNSIQASLHASRDESDNPNATIAIPIRNSIVDTLQHRPLEKRLCFCRQAWYELPFRHTLPAISVAESTLGHRLPLTLLYIAELINKRDQESSMMMADLVALRERSNKASSKVSPPLLLPRTEHGTRVN